jgi:membrane associated rhomboid family serine protease
MKPGIFTENEEFSWRKIMTFGALICFMASVLGHLVTHNFDELPASYQGIIAGVFAFYFMKSFFRKIGVKDE